MVGRLTAIVSLHACCLTNYLNFLNFKRTGDSRLSLKGCQIVAGGRSVAETTGTKAKGYSTLVKGARNGWHTFGVR